MHPNKYSFRSNLNVKRYNRAIKYRYQVKTAFSIFIKTINQRKITL
jgi:hypothetical protein